MLLSRLWHSLVPSPSFLALECAIARSKKVGGRESCCTCQVGLLVEVTHVVTVKLLVGTRHPVVTWKRDFSGAVATR